MGNRQLLERSAALLVVLLLGAAVYFQARGMARLLAAALLPSRAPARDSLPPEAGPDSPRAQVAPSPDQTRPPELTPRRDHGDPLAWPTCSGLQVLIVSESSDPWWSLTTVREAGESRARLRRVGDRVQDKQVAFIGYNPRAQAPAVWLEGNGTFCQSTLGWAEARVTATVATPPADAAPFRAKVQRSSDTETRIERALVEQTLEDPSSLMRSVRIIPEKRDGVFVGLRLAGLRPGALLSELGLRNGDRLEQINGLDLASPEQALQAYARLRTAQQLRVRLSRAGQPVELDVRIQ